VWAYSAASDALDLYSAANANSPTWVFLSTIKPSAAGAQTLSTSFTLPSGGLQAIRANFRYGGSASSCSTGAYDDHDDLIFAVSSSAPAPDFTISASPTSASVTQGSSTTDSITITPQNGFSGAVSLSATGLPAGVTASFNPSTTNGSPTTSTLTLTASSTATTGTATVTITGVSGSLAHTTTVSLTVNPTSTSVQLLGNTGFETGSAAPWTASTGVISNSTSEPPHAGTWDAWLDGYGTTTTDTLSQSVTVPSGKTTGTLSFYLHIDTAETGSTAYDKLTVQVGSTTVATFFNVNAASGYQLHSYNVSVTAGSSVAIKFTGTEDSSLQTSFVLDDVTFTVK
jgi:aminopeptidase S